MKENAPDLLRRALSRVPVEVAGLGDYQPAERKFGLSRRMVEVCLELGFPVSVLERSPLVLRGLDLLQEANGRARAVMRGSIISTPESAHGDRLRQMEQLAPPPEKCFAAMDRIPRPIIPRDKRAVSRRIVEALANQGYHRELDGEPERGAWAYRRAAWAIEDTPQDAGLIYRQMGVQGLESIEHVGPRMAGAAEALTKDLSGVQMCVTM